MDGGAWWAIVHGVAKSRTRLSDFTFPLYKISEGRDYDLVSNSLATVLLNAYYIPLPVLVGNTLHEKNVVLALRHLPLGDSCVGLCTMYVRSLLSERD